MGRPVGEPMEDLVRVWRLLAPVLILLVILVGLVVAPTRASATGATGPGDSVYN